MGFGRISIVNSMLISAGVIWAFFILLQLCSFVKQIEAANIPLFFQSALADGYFLFCNVLPLFRWDQLISNFTVQPLEIMFVRKECLNI